MDSGAGGGGVTEPDASVVPGCSAKAIALIDLVNDYRDEHGLPAIPASPSLCAVAAAHTKDLVEEAPNATPGCNLHSWSDAGSWTACCYTSDHAEAQCMWDKPRELTAYPGNGYENASAGSDDPATALALWQGSPAHDDVILNRDIWEGIAWGAVGADLRDGYAVLWFGQETDPAAQ
jgi:hypothetical protein